MGRMAIAFGIAAAVLAPVLELATGSPLPYLFVLTVLAGLAWGIWRLRRGEFGWRWGGRDHLVALTYPVLAMAPLVILALIFGRVAIDSTELPSAAGEFGLMIASTWVGVLITEDGFFRGALWGLGVRAGWTRRMVLVWTSLAFLAWHVAVPLIEEGFKLPAAQIPVYYANVLLLGLCWGLLRLVSGSLLVPVTAHAIWNGLAYVLFGYGTKNGLLGIEQVGIYGPERGVLGVGVNLAVLIWMLRWAGRRGVDLNRKH